MICPFWSFDISSYSKLFTCFTCTFLQIHIKQWYLYFWLTEDIKASEELVHLTLDKSRQHWPHQTMLRRDCCRATAIIPITLEHKLETLDHPAIFLFLSMLPNFTLYHHVSADSTEDSRLAIIMLNLWGTLNLETAMVDWLLCDAADPPAGGSPVHISCHLSWF